MSSPSISVRLPEPLREHLTHAATAERRSVSGLVRVLVEDGLVERDRQRAAQTLTDLGFTVKERR
jgi:hypothetical protein